MHAAEPARCEDADAELEAVAGTAPRSRTAASHARATSRLRGNGMPCVMMVLSSATTGRRAATAARTSSRTTNAPCVLRRLASSIPPVVVLTSYGTCKTKALENVTLVRNESEFYPEMLAMRPLRGMAEA